MTVLVILTGVISSIFPARKALKLNPAEAIRTEA
jgi:ABC-type antimicrobial peptide transport system permease subunit